MTTINPQASDANLTNTRNEYYDLVSVLYHALEGAKTHAIYRQDATSCGDQELAVFFAQCQQNDVLRAERAKQLLATRAPQHVPGYNPGNQAPTDQQPVTDESERDQPPPETWPSRSFDE